MIDFLDLGYGQFQIRPLNNEPTRRWFLESWIDRPARMSGQSEHFDTSFKMYLSVQSV